MSDQKRGILTIISGFSGAGKGTVVGRLLEKYPDIDFLKTVVIGDSYSDYLFAENIGSTFIYCPSL